MVKVYSIFYYFSMVLGVDCLFKYFSFLNSKAIRKYEQDAACIGRHFSYNNNVIKLLTH